MLITPSTASREITFNFKDFGNPFTLVVEKTKVLSARGPFIRFSGKTKATLNNGGVLEGAALFQVRSNSFSIFDCLLTCALGVPFWKRSRIILSSRPICAALRRKRWRRASKNDYTARSGKFSYVRFLDE